jgi:O-antigen/teichoic acid export membrane protein
MTVLQKFINGFVKRDGLAVLISTFLIKISGILISIIVVRLLAVKEYGDIAFAISIMGIFSAFGGIGSNWSLLRFGPGLLSISSKFQMFKYSVRMGSRYTVPVILLIIIASFFLPSNLKDSKYYLIILSFGILSSFLSQALESYFRIICKNKIYSKFNVIGSVMLLLLTVVLCSFLKGYGYVLSIVLAPLCTFLLFRKHVSFRKLESKNLPDKNFFTYGLYTSIGMIANQTTISLGPVIGGYLNAMPEDMAGFRVATIIPFNLTMLPLMIMTTDFVHFSKNSRNTAILKEYYFQYLKSIFTIAIIPFSILIFFNKSILLLLFGSKYVASSEMSVVLTVGVFFSYLFRIPLGNMLAAVGKSDWNVIHTFFWLIVFVPISIYSYHQWGMLGISVSISLVFILSGFISLFLFFLYMKNVSQNNIETIKPTI